jgi:O-antigen/teichoic acid export membrane protein
MSFTSRIVAGLGWTAGGRFLGQLVAWGVSIFVIRILNPEDYGLMAMATVLTAFAALFAELGLGWAVVHAREVDTPTLRRVFGMVILVNTVLFGLVAAAAPLVAAFFGEDRLIDLIRAVAFSFLLSIPSVIPNALLQRGLEFKWRSLVDLSAIVASGAATLALALAGFGVWSLVLGALVATAWRSLGINLVQPFMHLPSFSFDGLSRMFAFGGYVSISRMLLFVYHQADVVIGGRILGKEQVGFYSVGVHLASLPMQRVSAILNEVAFPAFARIQDERERVGRQVLRGVRLLSLFAFPVFWGIAAIAPEIVGVLLGNKWTEATLPLLLLALVMPLRMVYQLMPPTLQGVGKANLVARNQLLACTIMITAFLVGARFGIVGLAAAWIAAFPLVFVANLNTWVSVLGLGGAQICGAMGRSAVAGLGMLAAVTACRLPGWVDGLQALASFIAVGAASYTLLTLSINRKGVADLRDLLGPRRQSGRPRS